jgi:DNA-binding NarL/FixJ family response regulator
MENCRIVLADDHVLLRQGLRKILSENPRLEVVGEAGDGFELLGLIRSQAPDLVLLDISMPHLRGIEAIREIRALRPGLRILILTMHRESEYLFQAISAGADGYLLKDDAQRDLFSAIESVSQGKIYISRFLAEESNRDWAQIRRGATQATPRDPLTSREREVLKLIAEGRSSREIGQLLYISHRTVERHRANIMDKLNVSRTADLIRYALAKGYI